jgi:two-component system, OmpR family, phosphate regulon sensor histidine kinase PhoR
MIRGAKILIVDDEPPIRNACAKVLSEEGAFTEVAEDGRTGLEKAQTTAFDLVLVDLKMPQMDGMELLGHLNRLDPDLIKIVITGFATLETAVEAVQEGAYDYLPKPFTPGELRARVSRGLEKRSLMLEAKRLREERGKNLLELANEKSRTQTIIQCMGDGLLVANRDRQVVFCNPSGRRLLQIKRPLQVGESLAKVVDFPEILDLVEAAMNLSMGSEMTSKELPARTSHDPVLMANCAPVRDEQGETIGTVTVLRDITELKELDKAKSTFVTMVAHELRAPLAAIEGYLDVILNGMSQDDPQKTRQVLERSRERTQGLLTLINDLLALSRLQAGRITKEKERLRLGTLLPEVMELLKGEADERQVALELEVPVDLPSVYANREDIIRVFTNLLDNAIKYNRKEGKVSIRARADETFVQIEIRDTGVGIAPKDLEHIFDEFFRAKNKETRAVVGTGLGLPIAKKIVESLNGHIEVETQIHQGSSFRVLLPI